MAATVSQLWRFPIKSMAGEQIESALVTVEAGILGDRGYAILDVATGRIASAKHPRNWAPLLGFKPRVVERDGDRHPRVSIELPDGTQVRSDAAILDRQVPIILLTSQTQYAKIVAARDSGVTEIVAKPISPKLLQDRIVYVFQQPRPFVEAASYVGPSRRRRDANFAGEDRRGTGVPPAEIDSGMPRR